MLHSQRLVLWHSQTNHLDLGVKAVQIQVSYDPKRARGVECGHLMEVSIGEL